MYHVGFTGTRRGLTAGQQRAFSAWLGQPHPTPVTFHHGDCIGGDAEAHSLVRRHRRDWTIIVHPPLLPTLRAYCQGESTAAPLAFLARNRVIVESSTLLIACPAEVYEVQRSGTWATVRLARKLRLQILLCWPDGTTRSSPTLGGTP